MFEKEEGERDVEVEEGETAPPLDDFVVGTEAGSEGGGGSDGGGLAPHFKNGLTLLCIRLAMTTSVNIRSPTTIS